MAQPCPDSLRALGRRDDGQQKIRFGLAAGMDRVRSGIVVGVVVHVTGAADAIARLDIEADAMALPEHHRGGPDLDLDPHDLAGLKIKPPRWTFFLSPKLGPCLGSSNLQ